MLAPGTRVKDTVQGLEGIVQMDEHPNGEGWFWVRYDIDRCCILGRPGTTFHALELETGRLVVL